MKARGDGYRDTVRDLFKARSETPHDRAVRMTVGACFGCVGFVLIAFGSFHPKGHGWANADTGRLICLVGAVIWAIAAVYIFLKRDRRKEPVDGTTSSGAGHLPEDPAEALRTFMLVVGTVGVAGGLIGAVVVGNLRHGLIYVSVLAVVCLVVGIFSRQIVHLLVDGNEPRRE